MREGRSGDSGKVTTDSTGDGHGRRADGQTKPGQKGWSRGYENSLHKPEVGLSRTLLFSQDEDGPKG